MVLVSYNHPNRELASYLEDGDRPVHLIGDVCGTNSLMAAIHQASALARTL